MASECQISGKHDIGKWKEKNYLQFISSFSSATMGSGASSMVPALSSSCSVGVKSTQKLTKKPTKKRKTTKKPTKNHNKQSDGSQQIVSSDQNGGTNQETSSQCGQQRNQK